MITNTYDVTTEIHHRGLYLLYRNSDFAILRGRPRRFGFLNENGKPARTSAQVGGLWLRSTAWGGACGGLRAYLGSQDEGPWTIGDLATAAYVEY